MFWRKIRFQCLFLGVVLCWVNQGLQAQIQWLTFDDPDAASALFTAQNIGTKLLGQSKTDLVMHERFVQELEGIEVEGAHILTHTGRDGQIRINGIWVEGIVPATAKISFEQALDVVRQAVEGVRFYWEDPAMEALIRDLKQDQKASFYPPEKLVYFDRNYSRNGKAYKLAYQLDLYYHGPGEHEIWFVDAGDGSVLDVQTGCVQGHAQGLAETLYSGLRNIHTDSASPGYYQLYDRIRGSGIETRNARNFTKTDSSTAFSDPDNYWQEHKAATNAHWASGQTYDYYLQQHGRRSYDGKDSKILSYIHYDSNWFNASWNGTFARYGDGNGFPLTHIDVVAHELTHGVTGTSSKLIYRDQSGALNESFSDIFGTAVESFALPNEADWIIGKENFKLRSMANPNLFRHPDTYKGTNWYEGILDNGGVHTNSGVQNYWFYLLCNGGEGVNDLGQTYSVDSLGIEKAAAIAFANLVHYLSPSSHYFDARNGSIQAAADLYGLCSPEVNAVAQAWEAVGIGSAIPQHDFALLGHLSPVSSCEMGPSEPIVVQWMYGGSGCDSLLPAGSKVQFNALLNDSLLMSEEWIADADVHAWDTLRYTFRQRVDLSERRIYTLHVWMNSDGDAIRGNDSLRELSIVHPRYFSPATTIGFEALKRQEELPLFYLENRLNSSAAISIPSRNSGVYGLQLSGRLGNSLRELQKEFPTDPKDNFITNIDYISKMCLCVDARNWRAPLIQYDLKQTYSTGYADILETVRPELLSSMRISANGIPNGEQFHPQTPNSDSFRTQLSDLQAFAGTVFELCFEGKHFVERYRLQNDNTGDNSYLDNIQIHTGDSLREDPASAVLLHPNPGDGRVGFTRYQERDKWLDVRVSDLYDREIIVERVLLPYGFQEIRFDWRRLPAGMYLVRTSLEGVNAVQRLIIYR